MFSVVGHRVLSPIMFSMYTASKFAVTALLHKSLHKEIAASGSHIRVTVSISSVYNS